jgi:hypothetical protein
MIDDMGTFRTTIELENPAAPGRRAALHNVLVATGAELSWIPAPVLEDLGIARKKVRHFRQADGTALARSTGYAIVHVAGTETTTKSFSVNRETSYFWARGPSRGSISESSR